MANIHIPKTWDIPEREVTPEAAFINRRRFLTTLAGAGVSIAGGSILGCASESEIKNASPNRPEPHEVQIGRTESNFCKR